VPCTPSEASVRRAIGALASYVGGLLVEQIRIHVHWRTPPLGAQPSGWDVTAHRPELSAVGEAAELAAEPLRERRPWRRMDAPGRRF
jgi:hypothetical protein